MAHPPSHELDEHYMDEWFAWGWRKLCSYLAKVAEYERECGRRGIPPR